MTDTERLKDVISESGYKLEFLADKCGITRQALSNKITNKSLFTSKEIDILCKWLHITSLTMKDRIFFAKKVE